MGEFHDYRDLVKSLTSRPAKTEPYSNEDTTRMLLKITAVLAGTGATLMTIVKLLAPYL